MMISSDDIMCDCETAYVQKGETYLFSSSYQALKRYDKNLTNIENNEKNKKYGYVYKGTLHSVMKHSQWPFMCCSQFGVVECTTFVARI